MKNLLKNAKEEITRLRQRNEVLGAQVHVVNVFAAALMGSQRTGYVEGVDIVWQLQEAIDEIERQPSPQAPTDQQNI